MTDTNTIEDITAINQRWDDLLSENFGSYLSAPDVIRKSKRVMSNVYALISFTRLPVKAEVLQNLEVLAAQTDKFMTSYWVAYQSNSFLSKNLETAFEEQLGEIVRVYTLLENRVSEDIIAGVNVNTMFLKERYNTRNAV